MRSESARVWAKRGWGGISKAKRFVMLSDGTPSESVTKRVVVASRRSSGPFSPSFHSMVCESSRLAMSTWPRYYYVARRVLVTASVFTVSDTLI
jgi:hypothetical protein